MLHIYLEFELWNLAFRLHLEIKHLLLIVWFILNIGDHYIFKITLNNSTICS